MSDDIRELAERVGVSEAEAASLGPLAELVAALVADRVAERLAGGRPLLKLDQVAARLNCGETTVKDLVADGRLPVVRVGTGRGARRFDPDAVDEFVRRNTTVS